MEDSNGLDELDFAILTQLQDDGRKSFTEIAEVLNVSIGTIRKRVNKLIEDRTLSVIGRVDPSKVGFHAYAHIFIAIRPANLIENIAAQIGKLREVSFMAMISGDFDLEVDVMCRNNEHLVELTHKIQSIEGVFQTKTDMYLKVMKIAQPDLNLVNPITKLIAV